MPSYHVFTYGTLMFPEVMELVSGARFDGRSARLSGYARYAIRSELYPGLVPEEGRDTDGVVYEGVAARHLDRLDRFEGEWYERRQVSLRDFAGGGPSDAYVYVLREGYRHLLADSAWDAERFAKQHLAAFVRQYGGFSRL